MPDYTEADYNAYLMDSAWTRDQTAHLMELARQFDVRFIHMQDRWDVEKFSPRPSVEELKARYYGILGALDKVSVGVKYKLPTGMFASISREGGQFLLFNSSNKRRVPFSSCLRGAWSIEHKLFAHCNISA